MWAFLEVITFRSAVSCLLARTESRNLREIALWCVMRVVAGLTMCLYFSVWIPHATGRGL